MSDQEFWIVFCGYLGAEDTSTLYLRSLIWQQSGNKLGKGRTDQRELFLNLSNSAAWSSWAGGGGGRDRQRDVAKASPSVGIPGGCC